MKLKLSLRKFKILMNGSQPVGVKSREHQQRQPVEIHRNGIKPPQARFSLERACIVFISLSTLDVDQTEVSWPRFTGDEAEAQRDAVAGASLHTARIQTQLS